MTDAGEFSNAGTSNDSDFNPNVDPDNSDVWLTEEPEQKFPYCDWQQDVANGDTKLGYQEWVEHNIEAERFSPREVDDDN